MMNKLSLTAPYVIFLFPPSLVSAKDTLTLGGGVAVSERPYQQYPADVFPVPFIHYEHGDFWLRGFGSGYDLWNEQADRLSVTAYWSPTDFDPSASNNHHLRQFDRRKSTLMAGFVYVHDTPYGSMRTTLGGDILGNSNGITLDTALQYRYASGTLTLRPGIGIEWSSKSQNSYYYGISDGESRRSGLNRYDPNSGWSPYLELSAHYRVVGSWNIYGNARYTRLSREVTNSPMVSVSWSALASAGLTRTF